ncbi:phage tail protein [Streptomyces sp. NPDC048258]|uniref:phage tail protein n=1 Tax=Streptomyces sp. NPDC048258 TaxID=3365527 RepID=UPI00371BBCFC
MADNAISYAWMLDLGGFNVATAQSVSAPTLGREFVEVRAFSPEGNDMVDLVSGPPAGAAEVTISRIMDNTPQLTDWLRACMDPTKVDDSRQTVVLTMVNAKKEPVRRFEYQNAIAKSWDGPALQAGDSSAAVEQVTISYTAMEIVNV